MTNIASKLMTFTGEDHTQQISQTERRTGYAFLLAILTAHSPKNLNRGELKARVGLNPAEGRMSSASLLGFCAFS